MYFTNHMSNGNNAGNTSFNTIDIPSQSHNIVFNNSVKTPEWMILMDDLLNSTVEDFEEYAQLFGWSAEQSRTNNGYIANQLFTSATVQHSNVLVSIPVGIYDPVLEQKLNTGENIHKMEIVRLAHVGEERKPLMRIVFTHVKIESKRQEHDTLILSCRVSTRKNINYKYGQDGTPQGQSVTFFDFTSNSSAGNDDDDEGDED